MAGRAAVFLTQVRDTQLLDQTQLEEVSKNPAARGEDPMPLAKDMVQRGWLTPYQINQLVKGKGKDLILGPYRIIDRLGEGGMGEVYKAHHATMKRLVALKVIKKEKLSSPQAVQRFYREVQAASQLVHPNIVIAFDVGQANDTHYFAMEYIEGVDLSKLVKERGPLPVAEACEFMRQAAQGLQHAHEKGMVHRDIKPGNLLLSKSTPPGGKPQPVIKILDMGLARINTERADNITRDGAVLGTPHYLAPEQARNASNVDSRADIYSLGCTFYYLLTAKPPFQGELTEVLLKHQTEEPPAIEKLRPEVPPGVAGIVRLMMAKKPEDRYQTPGDVAEALGALVRKRGDAATKPTKPSALGTTPAPGRKGPADDATHTLADTGTPRKRGLSKGMLLGIVGGAVAMFGLCCVGALTMLMGGKDAPSTSAPVAKGTTTVVPATSTERTPKPTKPNVDPPRGGAVDLIAITDPAQHAYQGSKWEKDGGALVSPLLDLYARLLIPYAPPDNYTLTATVTRTGDANISRNGVSFGIMVGATQCIITIDGDREGNKSGIGLVDNKGPAENQYTHTGKVFTNNTPAEVVIVVRKAGVTCNVDGKQIINFNGPRSSLSTPPVLFGVPDHRCLYLGTFLSTYKISKLTLTPLTNETGRVLDEVRLR